MPKVRISEADAKRGGTYGGTPYDSPESACVYVVTHGREGAQFSGGSVFFLIVQCGPSLGSSPVMLYYIMPCYAILNAVLCSIMSILL